MPRTRPATPDVSPEMRRVLDHLAVHFAAPIRLAALAALAGCSRDRLIRRFRAETGTSVHAHVMRLRLARAALLLREGHKVEAAMLAVGYRSSRNFYRQFRARFGVTPGRLRTLPAAVVVRRDT